MLSFLQTTEGPISGLYKSSWASRYVDIPSNYWFFSVISAGAETWEHRCITGLSGMWYYTHEWYLDHVRNRLMPLFTYIIITPLIVPVSPSVYAHEVEQMGLLDVSVPHDPLLSNAAWTVFFPLLAKWGFTFVCSKKNVYFSCCSGMFSSALPCTTNTSVNTSCLCVPLSSVISRVYILSTVTCADINTGINLVAHCHTRQLLQCYDDE